MVVAGGFEPGNLFSLAEIGIIIRELGQQHSLRLDIFSGITTTRYRRCILTSDAPMFNSHGGMMIFTIRTDGDRPIVVPDSL
jgi:hypothetical protein